MTILEDFSENIAKCTNKKCAKTHLVTDNDTGEVFCSSCGQVIVERTEDRNSEQRTFTIEEYLENSRTGSKVSLAINDMGLSTMISRGDKDASGKSLSGELKTTFSRLRIWDSRTKSRGSNRTMTAAFILLDDMKTKLGIPDIVCEKAAYIFRKAIIKKLTSGRFVSATILASLYLACREHNTPRTLKDIASAANISKKDLSRHVRVLIKEFDFNVEAYDSVDFVGKIATSAGISESAKRSALFILDKARKKGLSVGKNPVAMAASALYLSSKINNESSTQKAISEASGISSVSIRSLGRLMLKRLDQGSFLVRKSIA